MNAQTSPSQTPTPDAPSPLRVVLADDHTVVREGLQVVLELAGVQVVAEAGYAEEILNAVKRERPDVVLLDVDLGDSSGLDLVAPIRRKHPGVKIILLTSDQRGETLQRALSSGIDGYQLKSTTGRELVASMHRVLEGGLVLPRSMKASTPSEQSGFPTPSNLDRLTPRERQIHALLLQGATNAEIVEALNISTHTAKTHVRHVMRKLSVRKRIDFLKKPEMA